MFSVCAHDRDTLSGGLDECGGGGELQTSAHAADDVCPWDVAGGGGGGDDKKRSLPTSIAEERERRLSTSSSRKNSGGNAATYDSASADEASQSDSVASRLRRSCGLGGGSADKRRGSSATCTPQQTVDRPSVSSAEDFDMGPSPENRSPEKPQPQQQHPPPVSPQEHQQQQPAAIASSSSSSLDARHNRKKLLKSLSLARKQSVTPVINVSSVDRECGGGKSGAIAAEDTAVTPAAETCGGVGPSGGGRARDTAAEAGAATASAGNADDNDVCPWEDE